MGPDQSQIAVISYSESAQVDIKFGEYTNVNDFTAALGEVRHQRKRTRIDLALQLAAENVFTAEGGARPNVTKVMVILTDGQQTETNDSTPLDEAVRPLLDMNVTIFAVGVGSAIDITELLELVGYRDENLFRAENFDQLARDSVKVATQTCKQLQPGKIAYIFFIDIKPIAKLYNTNAGEMINPKLLASRDSFIWPFTL